jgi:hypothetical protein
MSLFFAASSEGSSFLPQIWGLELGLRASAEPSEEIAGLTTEQEDQALTRLLEYRLIAGERGETSAFAHWSGLRVTGRGMQVLGVWPDLDQLASAVCLKLLLKSSRPRRPRTRIRAPFADWSASSARSARVSPSARSTARP